MPGRRSILNKLIINGFITVIISFLIAGTILFTIATSSVEFANEEKMNMLTLNAQSLAYFLMAEKSVLQADVMDGFQRMK